ncbi:MAG: hypothetical protein MJZ57_06480 [Bacteroidales bacterium]|nr:hypothetical protein [Bacteroidales bacterium]
MKKVFSVLAVAALFVIGFTSCDPVQEKTYADYLTYENGWVLASATSNPAYALSDGSYVSDLMTEGYLYESELDEVLTFNANGSMSINPGANIDPEWGYQQEVASTWAFNADTTAILMQLPFFYDETGYMFDSEVETCKILSLNENEMKLAFTFNDDEQPAKGEYTFILTYKHAK